MKKIILIVFSMLCILKIDAQALRVGSYNVRYMNDEDVASGNGWKTRAPLVCNLINVMDLDVFGSQEVLDAQLHDMLKNLEDYNYIGVGRDDGKKEGEYAPIFYKPSKLKLLKSGVFWLSQTPDVIGSVGWDAALPRICTYGYFKVRQSEKKVWFFNLHMDHVGVLARENASKLVLQKIKEFCGSEPAILTGDFNVDQHNKIYSILSDSPLLKDCYHAAKHRIASNGTWNDFKPNKKTDKRIDHIFVSPVFTVDDYAILTNVYWTPSTNEQGKYDIRIPSDHYPVIAEIQF